MLDMVYYLLTQDTDVNTATSGRITTDLRVQTQDTPAITIEYVSSEDLYYSKDSCKHYIYTIDIYVFTKTIGECDTLMKQVAAVVDRYSGTETLSTGNTYTVSNIQIQNRDIDVMAEADMVEGQLSLRITA